MSWQPAFGETRRKDSTLASERAKALRGAPTPTEVRLWKLLRMINREGAHFRRQAHVGGLVFDFADLGRKLLIECDGGIHALPDVAERDAEKAKRAEALGYRLLRISNNDVWSNPDTVLNQVRAALAAPSPLGGRVREGVRSEGTSPVPRALTPRLPRIREKTRKCAASLAAVRPDSPLPPAPAPRGGGTSET